MSCYWYLKCRDCNRYAPAARTSSRQPAGSIDGDEWLRAFVVAHAGHSLVSINEHNERELNGASAVDDDGPTEDEKEWMP